MRSAWLSHAKIWVPALVFALVPTLVQVNGAHALATAIPSENGSSSTSEARASQLQQIRTKTTFRNGRTLVNTGVGFVLGNLFFTVSHNLDPGYRVKHYNTQSYLAGVPVDAIAVDTTNDLAIIRIPTALCATWCNSLTVPDASSIGLQQKVEWLDEGAPPIGWQQAKVLSITRPQTTRAHGPTNTDCQSGLVVEITQPFPPGTSGTAVWDTQTHELLGMAQGSYERANGKTSGYFKPLACIIEHLQTHGLSNQANN